MSASDLVVLKGGLSVPVAALRLALALEDKGCVFRVDDDGVLLVGPRDKLSESDRAAIRQWRDDLARIVSYTAPVVQ
jgi:hypothetical protein